MGGDPIWHNSSASTEAAECLEWLDALGKQARRARQVSWMPVFSAGVIALIGSWLYLPSPRPQSLAPAVGHSGGAAGLWLPGTPLAHPLAASIFWLVALPAWYVVGTIYYRGQLRAHGWRTPVWRWSLTGVGLLAALAVSAPARAWFQLGAGSLPWASRSDWAGRGFGPLFIMVLTLPLLAWSERNRLLFAISVILAGTVAFADLYNISDMLGPVGPSIGDSANALFVGLTFIASGTVLRIMHRQKQPAKEQPVTMAHLVGNLGHVLRLPGAFLRTSVWPGRPLQSALPARAPRLRAPLTENCPPAPGRAAGRGRPRPRPS
jgi:hypothetical protein